MDGDLKNHGPCESLALSQVRIGPETTELRVENEMDIDSGADAARSRAADFDDCDLEVDGDDDDEMPLVEDCSDDDEPLVEELQDEEEDEEPFVEELLEDSDDDLVVEELPDSDSDDDDLVVEELPPDEDEGEDEEDVVVELSAASARETASRHASASCVEKASAPRDDGAPRVLTVRWEEQQLPLKTFELDAATAGSAAPATDGSIDFVSHPKASQIYV